MGQRIRSDLGLSIICCATSAWLMRLWRAGFGGRRVVERGIMNLLFLVSPLDGKRDIFCCNQPWQETWVTLPVSHYNVLLLYIRWSMKNSFTARMSVYWSHTVCKFTWKRHSWSHLFTLWMWSVPKQFNWIKHAKIIRKAKTIEDKFRFWFDKAFS